MERCPAIFVFGIHIRALSNKYPGSLKICVAHRYVQWSLIIRVPNHFDTLNDSGSNVHGLNLIVDTFEIPMMTARNPSDAAIAGIASAPLIDP